MQRYTFYLYLETALHISGGISNHHQEHTELDLQHLVLIKPLLLPAAIMEELELQRTCYTVLWHAGRTQAAPGPLQVLGAGSELAQ